jgi:predicted component of viral defense system (DUF524 family)
VTFEEEMNRIKRAVDGTQDLPGLATVLPRIAADPHGMLKTTELWIRRSHVRRPQPAALVRAVAREGNIDTDFRPHQVVDSRVEYTVDVYENRLLKAFVGEVDLRLRHLMGSVEKKMTPGPLLEQASQYLDTLIQIRRTARFLDEVGEHPGKTHTTMVLIRRPDYRAAFSSYLAFHRSATIRLWDDRLSAPLENVPSLYETWGTLRVVEALAAFAVEHGFEVEERLSVHKPGELFLRLLPDGSYALKLTHAELGTISLIPQRTYGTTGGLRSISFQQKPDVAIEVRRPNGERRIVIFDPKYKLDSELPAGNTVSSDAGDSARQEPESETGGLGKPKKVDIDKMHAYRDSIRDTKDHRVVSYAAILYPGQTIEFGLGLAAISARPSDTGFSDAIRSVLVEQLLRIGMSASA